MGKRSDKDRNGAASRVHAGYAGWPSGKLVPSTLGDPVPVINLTPDQFWRDYVCRRRPVVLQGEPHDERWRAGADNACHWSDNWLAHRAGSVTCSVEQRRGNNESYGQGRTQRMTFGEFLARLRAGDTSLYLSSQQQPLAPDGFPEVLAPPLTALQGAFSLRPGLMGNLIPQQVNMWMGHAPDGSSSGLHHDFHDNLYLLLRGRKRFRLYPPSDVGRMYTQGRPVQVHPNGRIVYEGQGEVLPDGSDAADVAQWAAQRRAEKELAAAEAAFAAGKPGAKERLAAAEAALEAALDAALDSMAGLDEDDDGERWDEEASEQEREQVLRSGVGNDGWDDHEATPGVPLQLQQELAAAEAAVAAGERGARRRLAAAEAALEAALEGDSVGATSEDGGEATGDGAGEAGAEEAPPSFSRIDLSLPVGELRRRFPMFPGVGAALTVELQAGQMLYLPCGWFHEVTSFSGTNLAGGSNKGAAESDADADCPAHLALNWWFHPPDNLSPGTDGLKQPYTLPFWQSVWEGRAAALEKAAQQQVQRWQQQGDVRKACCSRVHRRQRQRQQEGTVGSQLGLTAEAKVHIRKQLYGRMFGLGRRAQLYRFVGLHGRYSTDSTE